MADRETIDEMIEYFSRCCMNAQAGGAAQKQFERFMDVLALLREQEEPVEPVPVIVDSLNDRTYIICGSCKTVIAQNRPKGYQFCPWCGRKVKWDG